MCGIAGFVEPRASRSAAELQATATAMALAIRHRGPDDAGSWADERTGVALGHRRLSVIDLSPAGHQPMVSASGRFAIVFNGEIYDYQDLRAELESQGVAFRGHSDTEVLLEAIERWGLVPALQRTIGMFAFALWDAKDRVLHLARDRMGEKPLYHGFAGGDFLFASETKALRAHPSFTGGLDRDTLALFLRLAYVPAPHCVFEGFRQLPPGCTLSLPHSALVAGPAACAAHVPAPYWSLREAARAGLADPFTGTVEEAVDELERLLRDAVRRQVVSDVPLGAFLSGGIDSSTVVALMAVQSTEPVRTFTMSFREKDHDEALFARAIARHLGTRHEEQVVTPEEALAVIPQLPEIWDEPFADPSQVPTFMVARLARRHVTVSLSGDGGDELFGGYSRYVWARNIGRVLAVLPPSLRAASGRAVKAVPERAWSSVLSALGTVVPPVARRANAGEKVHRLADLLALPEARDVYLRLVSHWLDPSALVPGAREPGTALTPGDVEPPWRDPVERMQLVDSLTYLPDDILVKVDRAAMAVSLESRVPLLDHRVVEFAWRLPPQWKVRDGRGKWILRQVLKRHVPPRLWERPKAGFGVPIETWLRGPLRDWAESLLSERSLTADGLLDPRPIRDAWKEHLEGRRPHHYRLWNVLMLQAWRQRWRG
jgi:asparagine synthase (glutamine-hydrolysing)